jgi:hypothetical protein
MIIMFKIIDGITPEEKPDYLSLHLSGLISALKKYSSDSTTVNLCKICFHGVKYGYYWDKSRKKDFVQADFEAL